MADQEKRKCKRYKIKSDVYITFRPHFHLMGKMKDVSRGGLGFEYTRIDDHPVQEKVEVDIFSASNGLHMARIPCRVAYDVKVGSYPSFESLETRRCGLQFSELSMQQIGAISNFITSFATAS